MNASRRVGLLFSAILILLFGAVTVHGAPFTAGNLVIYRVHNGVGAIPGTGTAIFLDEYTTGGILVQSIAVPTTTVGAQRRVVCSGTATTEGFLNRSTDGQYVVFSGYDAALGDAVTTSNSTTVPRVIGRVAANGTLDTSTALTDAISGGNPRSAASTNGTDLWISGTSGGGGVRYATFGATTSTSLGGTPTNLRVLGIFGGQLYVSTASGTTRLATVGTGTPTTGGQTITNLPGFPTAGNPNGFFFADLTAGVAGMDTVYVADDGGTVQKYSLVGGNWTANGTVTLATARGITGSVAGSNVTLYVTARTALRTFTDTSGYNATITGAVSTLASAAANTAMQGVAFVPQAVVANQPIVPTCPSPVTTTTGTATTQGVSATDADGTVTGASITSITPADPGTITLTGFTPAGAVGGTANATLDVGAATPANTYSVTIQWVNNDGVPQTANCVVSVVVNAPPVITYIHNVQGNGAATPMPGATVTIEGVVIGDFQPIPNDNRLSGFFVQEEDTDANAENDPATSEGIFIFCSACPTNVVEGQKVQITGTVSEFFNNTQITATTAGSVVITNAGNNLAQVTPATIDLPVTNPSIDAYYEPMENMLVTYNDTLTVSEYFEQARYGRIELYEGGRPRQFAEANPPNVAGYAAHLDNLSRRRVYIDDDDNVENSVLNLPNGSQFVFVPQAFGGLSIGTQGLDFFRGGDLVNGLTGILHWSFSGGSSPDEWRIRPTATTPAAFTVANPRPATPPAVGGHIRAASVNVLNYFTTLNQRGADSTAELDRQRERISIVLCSLNADVAALMEIENHATNVTITDLLNDVNIRCGGTHPYTFVNTGGALGTDEIRVMLIYRTGVLAPFGVPLSDTDPVHNRPPTAQTFDVVDALNPAFGQRFTALANHSKSKGSCPGAGADTDQNDGQACWAVTRVNQANRIVSWVNSTVIPAAGDPDVLLLGDFNAYAQENATTAITGAGYTDLETAFLGANAYSYLFDGQLGHIDYAFSSASLTPQITGVAPWHINADENPLFDYNDEIDDGAAESFFEEKPDGSLLAPPRNLFQSASPYRASDHDPVLLGIFQISDLAITKTDSPDPVASGTNLTYTITVTNNGPDAASSASWSDNLTDTAFVSLSPVAGWSCTTPAVGAMGLINCTNPTFGVGNAVFTLTTAVPQFTVNGTVLSNSASVTSSSTEGDPGDENATETTTVANSADLSVTKSDSPDPVTAGNDITYTITLNNAGPSFAE
ncbi:MAG TPA: ExeM/NucH family extracellular endonuclease, partial [Thermoanaerobaculia bacterium]|nr:ExeM/NucH family extracellular endonuclease [Thermoanaerobaculia bacterium]